MDSTDYLILNSLQQDCTRTLRSIGDEVGLTPPAVSDRIHKMEDEGIISAYGIRIDRTRLDCAITGYIMVAAEPEKYTELCRFCEEDPGITEHHHVIGRYNAVLRFAVRNTAALYLLLKKIKEFGDSLTSVELKTYFDTKELPVR